MKIGIFTNNYLPNPYGVTGSVESFRREFERLGHDVFIFAPFWMGYTDENKNVFRYPSIDFPFLKFRFPLAIPYSRKIDRILEKLDLDIIHSQHPNLLGSAAKKWAKKKRIPLVFTWHTLYDKYAHFATILPSRWIASWLIKNAVDFANGADQVIVPTDSIIPIMRNWGVANEAVLAIPTGVEEKEFENPDGEKIRKELGIAKEEILIVLVSRMTQEKNVEFIFEALEEILKKDLRVKFLAVGGGNLLGELEDWSRRREISEKIIFTGEVPRGNVKNYYSAGDIFVYSSLSETQGMVITEAMHLGLPIVAIHSTGIESLVEEGKNGFLTKFNKQEFSDKVSQLIQDEDLRKKMGQESLRISREKYTSKVCAKKMLEIYEELIKNKK